MDCSSQNPERRPESSTFVFINRPPERMSGQLSYLKDNKSAGTLRLFFALWPAAPAAQSLHSWALAAHALTGGRVTRAETIHLTLAFLGDVPGEQVAALNECAGKVRGRAFDLRLDEGRWWRHNNIVWAGPKIMPEALRDLAEQLDGVLKAGGFRTEKRAFKAHVSLIRRAIKGDALPEFVPIEWRVNEFVLVRSALSAAGPAYAVVSRLPLSGERSG
jgi:RNA 2',3'-cyclic 3'-phosphodiesterase